MQEGHISPKGTMWQPSAGRRAGAAPLQEAADLVHDHKVDLRAAPISRHQGPQALLPKRGGLRNRIHRRHQWSDLSPHGGRPDEGYTCTAMKSHRVLVVVLEVAGPEGVALRVVPHKVLHRKISTRSNNRPTCQEFKCVWHLGIGFVQNIYQHRPKHTSSKHKKPPQAVVIATNPVKNKKCAPHEVVRNAIPHKHACHSRNYRESHKWMFQPTRSVGIKGRGADSTSWFGELGMSAPFQRPPMATCRKLFAGELE